MHLIMTDFRWEADALVRAKKLYAQGHDMTVNSLDGASWMTCACLCGWFQTRMCWCLACPLPV